MVLIICLVLFIWTLDGLCADYDHEAERRNDYRRAERRHQCRELQKGHVLVFCVRRNCRHKSV